ncbi:hypothetical protein BGW36DRAFT_404169 [Talaromyces proteolyticus]|uniref:Uncharacterized protein n=1 Tax=Talaromyces proteolyticus TaxID=1131652 RepID=A0AAD4L1F4_9EURO|nr:uncharacterized protein BGW36DRAFT_404169 [Talaromyces proteolyticus]KAH8703876.1 hypothetical protein BGW36DRAFT_404169 [Talaromyces proteolyticus]
MSATANGTVFRPNPNQILNVFTIDGSQYTFASSVATPLPPFQAVTATINYDYPDQLIANRFYDGSVQGGQLNIQLDNGVRITATVEPPIDVGRFQGQGHWEVEQGD